MTSNADLFLPAVLDCIREADRHGPVSDKGSDVLGDLSGRKTVGVLQRLVGLFAGDTDACYLEVGVFQGLTLLSVAVNFPDMACFGIDDFSILDPEGKNLGIVTEKTEKLAIRNVHVVNLDFEEALESLEAHIGRRRIGVYYVDGAHDYRSQLMGLMLALPYLHERAVIVVDDANYRFVRQANRDFLFTHPEHKLVFDSYSPAHPANMDPATLARWETGWLNGVNILVRDPEGLLPAMYPPTHDDRTLYVNDWLVHRLGLAELAPEAVHLAQAICSGDAAGETTRRRQLIDRFKAMEPVFEGRFPDRNTYSEDLPEARFNALSP